MEINKGVKSGRSAFAVIMKGETEDFIKLVEMAKAHGLYIVYTKTSFMKLVVKEEPF